ncbi:MAG: hypothetical protein IKM64_06750, partial [Clostridia bacterium]|nr:hypothetical protein [Clostridia bacterium]
FRSSQDDGIGTAFFAAGYMCISALPAGGDRRYGKAVQAECKTHAADNMLFYLLRRMLCADTESSFLAAKRYTDRAVGGDPADPRAVQFCFVFFPGKYSFYRLKNRGLSCIITDGQMMTIKRKKGILQ